MSGSRSKALRRATPAGPGWKQRVRQAKRRWARLGQRERKREGRGWS